MNDWTLYLGDVHYVQVNNENETGLITVHGTTTSDIPNIPIAKENVIKRLRVSSIHTTVGISLNRLDNSVEGLPN